MLFLNATASLPVDRTFRTMRLAAASRLAFAPVNFKANLSRVRENHHLACLVAAWATNKRIFAGVMGVPQRTVSPL